MSDAENLYRRMAEVKRSSGPAAASSFVEQALAGKSFREGDEILEQMLAFADAANSTNRESGEPPMSSDIQRLEREIAEFKRRGAPPIGDRKDFIAAQSRADQAYQLIGDSAPAPLAGEPILGYRARLLAGIQKCSPKWKDVSFGQTNPSLLDAIEADVYADAEAEARHPSSYQPGQLRAIKDADPSGRVCTRYVGDPNACWDQFNPGVRYVRRLLLTAAR